MHRTVLLLLVTAIGFGAVSAEPAIVYESQQHLILRPIVTPTSSIGFGDGGGNCVIYPDSMKILSGHVSAEWAEPLPTQLRMRLFSEVDGQSILAAESFGASGMTMAFEDVPQAGGSDLGWGYFFMVNPGAEPALLYPEIHLTIRLTYEASSPVEPAATDAACSYS